MEGGGYEEWGRKGRMCWIIQVTHTAVVGVMHAVYVYIVGVEHYLF
jgi:hypothetical protein